MSDSQRAPRQLNKRDAELSYQKISISMRKELIKLVVQQNFSVYRASKLLNINNSTAKAIMRKFRANGTIFIRKAQKFLSQSSNRNHNLASEDDSLPPSAELPVVPQVPVERSQSPVYFMYFPMENYVPFQNTCYLCPYL